MRTPGDAVARRHMVPDHRERIKPPAPEPRGIDCSGGGVGESREASFRLRPIPDHRLVEDKTSIDNPDPGSVAELHEVRGVKRKDGLHGFARAVCEFVFERGDRKA